MKHCITGSELDNLSSLVVLHEALDNLEEMTEAIRDAYLASLEEQDFDTPEEVSYDFESVNQRLWDAKEAQGLGTREEFEERKREKDEQEAEEREKAGSKAGKKGGKMKR